MEERFDDVQETTEVVETVEAVETEETVETVEVPVTVEKKAMSKNVKLGIAAGVAVVVIAAGVMMTSSNNSGIVIEGYKGIEVEGIESIEVDEAYINDYIDYVLQSSTVTEPVDRAAKDGDVVNIDYVGTLDGVEFEGGTAEAYDLMLGSGTFIEGFEEQLIGAEAGDKVTVKTTFPEDYNSEELAGQDTVFAVTVNEVKESVVPELTDELVVTLSYESTTVEEYMEEVKAMLEQDAVSAEIEGMKSQVWTTFIDSITIENYPEKEVAAIEEKIIASVESQAVAYGMEMSEFIASAGMDDAAFDEYVVESAKQEYLMQQAVYYVAKAEGLTLSQEDMDAEVELLVTQAGFADIAAANEAGYTVEDLELNVLTEVVVTWLTENATIVEPASEETLEEVAE